jgi:hypothetical protein
VSKHVKYVPKHAAPRRSRSTSTRTSSRTAARKTVLLTGLAVSATAASVGTGVIVSPVSTVATLAAESSDPAPVAIAPAAGRATRADDVLSRDADRTAEPRKAEKAEKAEAKPKPKPTPPPAPTDPRDIARAMLPEFGFAADQFGCLDALWVSESDWRVDADNPTSSAYGIPQALTETHDMPPGYMTDATVQIRWGLGYIRDAYGTPCGAWSFKQGNGWY